jgi:hypothetical protein
VFAKAKLVATRRWKRRLKAAASIAVAAAAGTFLACQRGAEYVKGAVLSPEEEHAKDAGADARATATAQDEPVVKKDAAAVDVSEHRKGMPVRDNLLE